ncbi:MAG TPA: hypothetical protein VMW25_04270 [Clostridia bacterium]|nr:hypothetical protein [Clostridia bacterium]
MSEKVLGFKEFDLENICGLSAMIDKYGDWWGMDTNLGDLPNQIREITVPVRLKKESVELKWLEKYCRIIPSKSLTQYEIGYKQAFKDLLCAVRAKAKEEVCEE